MGSPARASSSTTEPWANCRMYLIGTLVRPNSTDSCTGMSSTMLMSLREPSPFGAPPEDDRDGSPPDKGPPGSCTGPSSARFCSSSASAQPAMGSSAGSWFSSDDILISNPVQIVAAQALLDPDRIL